MQSTLAGKQKNMGHPIISGFILGFESNTCRDFYECGSNSWTGESHCNAGIYVGCFSHSGGSEIWGMLDNKTSTVTCKVHCKHSISLTTGRKWSISRKWMYIVRKEMTSYCVGIMDAVLEEEKMLWAWRFQPLSCEVCTEFLCCFSLSRDLRLMKPPAEAFIREHFCVSMFWGRTFTCFTHSKWKSSSWMLFKLRQFLWDFSEAGNLWF